MAGIATERADVLDMMVTPWANHAGAYVVQLWVNGRKEYVLVDDYVPVKKNWKGKWELAMAKASDDAMWVPLVEKAWAKLHGSYATMVGGDPAFAGAHVFGTATWSVRHNQNE